MTLWSPNRLEITIGVIFFISTTSQSHAACTQECLGSESTTMPNGACDGILLTDASSIDSESNGVIRSSNAAIDCDVRWSNGTPAYSTCVTQEPYTSQCEWKDDRCQAQGGSTVDGFDAVTYADGQSSDLLDQGCTVLGAGTCTEREGDGGSLNANSCTGSDFSLSMWIKVNGTGNTQIIGSTSRYGGYAGLSLYVSEQQGELRIGAQSRPARHTRGRGITSIPIQLNKWMHVVFHFINDQDNCQGEIIVNTKSNGLGSMYPIGYSPDWRIGDQGWGSISGFSISAFTSYTTALTDNQIRVLFADKADLAGFGPTFVNTALDAISTHISAGTQLTDQQLTDHVITIQRMAPIIKTSRVTMQKMLDLIETFESTSNGPLFATGTPTAGGFPRAGTVGDSRTFDRAILALHQLFLDSVFTTETVANCGSCMFEGHPFQTANTFPGALAPPNDPTVVYTVSINATLAKYWGKIVAFATEPARKPTGLYLAPGELATVTVPNSVVTAGGYTILVGAITSDNVNKGTHRRLDRIYTRFVIKTVSTTIANPNGGGVYIEVPYLADNGMIQVSVTGGVVQAPYFKLDSWDESRGGTSDTEWLQRRASPAPWADFESDKFMMQVPTSWIYAFDDPRSLLRTWDECMDGVVEMVGYPPNKRNKVVMYLQPDLQIKHGAYGIGYPQVNNLYNPTRSENGNKDHWFLRNPRSNQVEYHETGHAQMPYKYGGESEAIVNVFHAYVAHQKFGVDLETAFQESFGAGYGQPGFAPDEAAIHWMVTKNFRNSYEMDKSNTENDQFRYQERGYAKYFDIAEMFGWEPTTGSMWKMQNRMNLDYENNSFLEPFTADGVAYGRGLSHDDMITLRYSLAAGYDLTPLIHFWGIDPDDAAALASEMVRFGLGPSQKIHDMLIRRATVVLPQNNTEFNEHFDRVFPGRPSGGNPKYGKGWYNVWRDVWDEQHAAAARVTIQETLDTFFPAQSWTELYLAESNHAVNRSYIEDRCYIALHVGNCASARGVYKVNDLVEFWPEAASDVLDNGCGAIYESYAANSWAEDWNTAISAHSDLMKNGVVVATYQAKLQRTNCDDQCVQSRSCSRRGNRIRD